MSILPIGQLPDGDVLKAINECRSSPSVMAAVAIITPEVAARLLESHAGHNRSLNNKNMIAICNSMHRKWHMNYESIKIDDTGVVRDGYHRLKACVETEVSFTTLIIFNIPAGYAALMDMGKSRSAGDHHAFSNESKGRARSVVVRNLISLIQATYRITASDQEVHELSLMHPKISDSLDVVGRCPARIVSQANLATIHYLGVNYLRERKCVNEYVRIMKTGADVGSESPVLHAREYLINISGSKKDGLRFGMGTANKVLTHALNLHLLGESCRKFSLPSAPFVHVLKLDTNKLVPDASLLSTLTKRRKVYIVKTGEANLNADVIS
jgi:hypothetical protein